MAKSITITPRIEALIKAAAGEDIDTSNLSVFEAIAVNTKPLQKSGSLFDKAQLTRATLVEMANSLNAGESVPLHTLHMQGDELPVGKLFFGEVLDAADGSAELRVLFYVPSNKAELIADINSALIDEVSVGVKAKKALCSECGWDYFGPDASILNLFERVCANDHKLGVDGIHLNLSGLDRWFELSLVSKGAANNAKILSRAKTALASADLERMAASGASLETHMLIASVAKEDTMDVKEFVEKVTGLTASLTEANGKVAELTAAVEANQAKVAELTAKLAEAEAKATIPDLSKELADVKAELQSAADFLADQAKRALVATGAKEPAVPTTVSQMITTIQAAQTNLINLLPEGGRSLAAHAGSVKAPKPGLDAFKTRS